MAYQNDYALRKILGLPEGAPLPPPTLSAMDLTTPPLKGTPNPSADKFSPFSRNMLNSAYGGRAVLSAMMLDSKNDSGRDIIAPFVDSNTVSVPGSSSSVSVPGSSSGNQISASIDPDIDEIKDEEADSIQNQWKSFLAEYERIYDEANDAQKANWQAAADWNERMYRDQWKMQVEGLREAGINPLMMAGALRASSVPQMSAASVVAPSFPSNEFSATANTEIAGLYSLYATLSTLQSEERRAELARILGYAELSQQAADSILRFIGSFIPSTSIIKRG